MSAKLPDGARQHLEGVLCSRTFQNATRLRSFLRFLVEKKIGGESHLLKETVLGMEVFRRGPHFDPKTDPIVRVDARRLRAKLDQYYAREGAADPVRIILKAGSYVPSFETRGDDEPLGKRSVAVLPFTILSSHVDDAHFSEGLTEEILNALAQTRQVLVIGARLGSRCDADQVVRGSIRREGRRLRVTVRLVAARDSSVVWSEQYDIDADEIFSPQETISRRVAIAVGMRMFPERLSATPGFHIETDSATLGLAS